MSIATTTPAQRYHPVQVTLHWLIAGLVFLTPLLAEGEGRLRDLRVAGLPLIGIHMALGIAVLALLLIRLVTRFALSRPQWATTGSSLLDLVGRLTHLGLYFFTFAVTVTGLIFALQTNRLQRAFSGQAGEQFRPGQSEPGQQFQPGQNPPPGGEGEGEGFRGGLAGVGRFIFRAFHELSWKLLLALIVLHVAATFYHQFWKKDHLLSRMWFGRMT